MIVLRTPPGCGSTPSAATHLLRAGVDLNTIRAWLGHVKLDTTNIYAEIDFETKARAIALCDQAESEGTRGGSGMPASWPSSERYEVYPLCCVS